MKVTELLPQADKTAAVGDWSQFPMPTDLNPQQKQQIALLLGRINQTTSNSKENTDAISVKTSRRSPRQQAAR